MAEETFAARLRALALMARQNWRPEWAPVPAEPSVILTAADLEAIAEALGSADCWDDHLPGCQMWRHEVEHLGQLLICSGKDTLVADEPCTCGYDEFRAALDRLNAHLALKSAEGQPGS